MAAGLMLLLSGAGRPHAAARARMNPFAAVRFLVGLEGLFGGPARQRFRERTYRFVLGDKFLHERNVSTYPPSRRTRRARSTSTGLSSAMTARATPSCSASSTRRASSTVRIVEQPGPGRVLVFESEAVENIPAGWKARETYTCVSIRRIHGDVRARLLLGSPGRSI